MLSEQGIITETTKNRLTEPENLISQYDVEILKEKPAVTHT